MLTFVRARRFILGAVAIGLLVGPGLFLAWLRWGVEDRLSEVDPPAEPLVITVEHRLMVDDQLVNASLEWGRPLEVFAPNWSGVVTDIYRAAGETVTSGESVLSINGVDRLAFASNQPLWRPLRRGDTGADVDELQRLLVAKGYDVQPDGEFGATTQEAVKLLEASLGISKPSGVFDPGWVLWLPSETFQISSIAISVGSPAPSAGSVVLAGPPPLLHVEFQDDQDVPLDLSGPWVFTSAGLEYSILDGSLEPDSLTRLQGATGSEVLSISGRVISQTPIEVIGVPATAVMSSADGDLCVWVPGPDGYLPRSVELEGGAVAQVFVLSGLSAGDQVLANPADILSSQTCH